MIDVGVFTNVKVAKRMERHLLVKSVPISDVTRGSTTHCLFFLVNEKDIEI